MRPVVRVPPHESPLKAPDSRHPPPPAAIRLFYGRVAVAPSEVGVSFTGVQPESGLNAAIARALDSVPMPMSFWYS